MKFDLPSFLLGSGVGASTMLLGKSLHPLLLELATIIYRCVGSVVARASMNQEYPHPGAQRRRERERRA